MEEKKKSLGEELQDILVERKGEGKTVWNLSRLKIGEFEEELWSVPVKGISLNVKLKRTSGTKSETVKVFYYARGIGCDTITFYTGEVEIKDTYKDDTLKEKLPREDTAKHYRKVDNLDQSVKDLVKELADKLAEVVKNTPEAKPTTYSGGKTEKTSSLTKGMLDNKLTEHCRSCPVKKYAKSYESVAKMTPVSELEVSMNQRANLYRRVLDDFTQEGIPTGEYMGKCDACKREFLGKLKSITNKGKKNF